MKKILKHKFGLLLLAGVFALAACNKEEDPFAGKDSYITAFSLRQGESVFHAAIAGEEIIVTVPEGFVLSQAKATVKLSENATIYPDPATVTNWDEEHRFIVTAYNGTQSDYRYSIAYRGVAHTGSVMLYTQADVDAFGQKGVTFLEGSLIIGRAAGTDSITSLAPLAGLKEVTYNLTIHPTFAGAGLDGLNELENVSGSFTIGALTHLETLALPALKTVGSFSLRNTITFIAEFPELVSAAQMFSLNCPLYQLQLPGLRYTGSLYLTAAPNASTSLAKISLPALEEVGGALSITVMHSVTRIDLPVLKKIEGGLTLTSMNQLSFVYAPRLEGITGLADLVTVPSLTEFVLPELKTAGSLNLSGAALNVLDFPKLTEVTGTLTIRSLPASLLSGSFPVLQTAGTVTLYDLKDPGKLELPATVQRVGRLVVETVNNLPPEEINIKGKTVSILEIRRNALKVDKLVGDEVFPGTLVINASQSTTPYPGYPMQVEGFHVVDSLNISGMTADTVVLSGLRKINRGASISASSAKHFRLPELEETGGMLSITLSMGTTTATTLAIEKLKRVGGNFTMSASKTLLSLKDLSFPELTAVDGNFDLSSGILINNGFETLNCPKLATVGGKLTIRSGTTSQRNQVLKNLDGFANLASVGSIEITRQSVLEDYEGLKELFKTLPQESWIMPTNCGYMPTWQDLKDGKWTK
jgi:hypothetical protein